MFAYFSKRIAIPSGTNVTAVGWNETQGWFACGGEGGLLKVMKVDSGTQAQKNGSLSINQTLEGHSKTVCIVCWNQLYRKLTSCDESGRIIVWTLHKGMWFEEMVNNRNQSRVVDLSWSVDGNKICVAYEDGAIVVGYVDGSRLWNNDYQYQLAKVCWSPDDRYLLFGTSKGEVFVHDAVGGQYISQVNIQCEESPATLAALLWHPAWVERPEPLPTLSICYTSGKMQLMEGIRDERAHLIQVNMTVEHVAWNPQGTVVVVCGVSDSVGEDTQSIVTQFFNNEGIRLRTLRVNGRHCGGVTWEGDGLRVAIAVDSSIYFANVRPYYKYCYFKKTLVFSFNRPDKVEDTVMFWNVKNNGRTVKHVRKLLFLMSHKDACAMVSCPDPNQAQYMVQLLNSIGSPIGIQFTDIEPLVSCMNSSNVVCCSEEAIYIWQFRDPNAVVDDLDPISMQASRNKSQIRVFHIDDIVRPETMPTMKTRSAMTNDLICAACINESRLLIGRESGVLQVYTLDPLNLVGKLVLSSRPHLLGVNCDSTMLTVVDSDGVLRVFPLEKDISLVPRKAVMFPNVERKDVWGVLWASDDPNSFIVMEKTRVYIFNGLEPDKMVHSCANVCKFRSLKARAVHFDELMLDPERPRKECLVDFETKTLRDMREVLEKESIDKAFAFVNKQSHPKLWSIFAEHALMKLNFTYAEMAFIKARDYPAIQFVKRIHSMDDKRKQEAEIHAYFHRIDEAEKIYRDMDRKDLALELRFRLGDWFGVVRLVQEGGGDEVLMSKAWENIGDQYADRQKWSKAAQYYTQCRSYRKLAKVYYLVQDYNMLVQLIRTVEHDKELLIELGQMFLSVGMAEEAARAFLAAGEPRMVVDGCVKLNMWDRAILLAKEHQLENMEKLLNSYAQHLIKKERFSEAIELFCKASQHDQAARLLAQLGQRVAQTDPLRAKKFHVLSALEVEKYRKKKMGLGREGAEVVHELLQSDQKGVSERALDSAWRGAEAYHFFLLCQKQIMENNPETALVVAMRLMEYDDLIAPIDSYSLIALTSYMASNFGICSRAFIRLEMAERNDEEGNTGGIVQNNFSLDLDVTQKTMAGATVAESSAGASTLGGTTGVATSLSSVSALSGTTTSAINITNNTGGVSSMTSLTYPTVSLNEPSRRFANLAIQIFTKHHPVDTSIDSVHCPRCGTFNKEWANSCVKCEEKFDVCICTGRCITSKQAAWQCASCHHKALDIEAESYANCPLCHTPRLTRIKRGF
ncbi:unnamed protein product [Phytomonas sp. EM1]|nr:unnamed protein product [Phytomonas sp. EM1]|eukprot:CCW60259.1 unnamed protein product [Phytomonas sp. isolate EM1]